MFSLLSYMYLSTVSRLLRLRALLLDENIYLLSTIFFKDFSNFQGTVRFQGFNKLRASHMLGICIFLTLFNLIIKVSAKLVLIDLGQVMCSLLVKKIAILT